MAKICPKKVRIPHFLVGRRPTTDLFDENWAGGPYWRTPAVWSRAARVCGPKAHTPEPPAGARIYWRVAPINSSDLDLKKFVPGWGEV